MNKRELLIVRLLVVRDLAHAAGAHGLFQVCQQSLAKKRGGKGTKTWRNHCELSIYCHYSYYILLSVLDIMVIILIVTIIVY